MQNISWSNFAILYTVNHFNQYIKYLWKCLRRKFSNTIGPFICINEPHHQLNFPCHLNVKLIFFNLSPKFLTPDLKKGGNFTLILIWYDMIFKIFFCDYEKVKSRFICLQTTYVKLNNVAETRSIFLICSPNLKLVVLWVQFNPMGCQHRNIFIFFTILLNHKIIRNLRIGIHAWLYYDNL